MRRRLRNIDTIALMLAVLLFGFAALTVTPASLGQGAQGMFAAVGVNLAVTENPYNAVAAQLDTKQRQLDQREAQMVTRENSNVGGALSSYRLGVYSLGTSVALFILVALNFYFDIKRRHLGGPTSKFSIDLR